MSRYSGCWVGLKIVSDRDSGRTYDTSIENEEIIVPSGAFLGEYKAYQEISSSQILLRARF